MTLAKQNKKTTSGRWFRHITTSHLIWFMFWGHHVPAWIPISWQGWLITIVYLAGFPFAFIGSLALSDLVNPQENALLMVFIFLATMISYTSLYNFIATKKS